MNTQEYDQIAELIFRLPVCQQETTSRKVSEAIKAKKSYQEITSLILDLVAPRQPLAVSGRVLRMKDISLDDFCRSIAEPASVVLD